MARNFFSNGGLHTHRSHRVFERETQSKARQLSDLATRNFNECISNHFGCLDFFPSAPLVEIRYEFNFSFLFTVRNFTNTRSQYGTLPLHKAA